MLKADSRICLEELYGSYLNTVSALEKSRKPGDGLFGLKGGPADDPCHERFADDLSGLLAGFASENPDSAAIRDVLQYIYEAPCQHPEPKSAYWMLIAVHGCAQDLIGRLSPADANALAERYADLYPRNMRLPVQDSTLAALRRAGGVTHVRRLFRR